MAKSSRQRAMPSTPQDRPAPPPASGRGPGDAVGHAAAPTPAPSPTGRKVPHPKAPRPAAVEAAYVLAGTGCTSGHERGRELDAGRLGTLPSRKRARIGFGMVIWCVGGLVFLASAGLISGMWWALGAQVALLWLAFAAVVVRSAGHRKRCWRTRTWRHAWGGLAPGS